MDQFIDCHDNGNLSVLVVSGQATDAELAAAWSSLLYEFYDLTGNKKAAYRVRLLEEINLKQMRIDMVRGWLKVLDVIYMPSLVEAIRKIGFEYELNPDDGEQYRYEVQRIHAEINLEELEVLIKTKEYEAMNKNKENQQEAEAGYWRRLFFRINNYAKREAVNGQTFVADFCVALRDYNDYIDSFKNKKAA